MDEQADHHKNRSVSRIVNSIETTEGGGFVVHRPLPTKSLLDFDPFLLLDEMGPKDWNLGLGKRSTR